MATTRLKFHIQENNIHCNKVNTIIKTTISYMWLPTNKSNILLHQKKQYLPNVNIQTQEITHQENLHN